MIRLDIPNRGLLELDHAVFDVNGTLAVDGQVIPGVAERIRQLSELVTVHALTAGSHGNLEMIEVELGIPLRRINSAEDKANYVRKLNILHAAAIGNGMNDVEMLRLAGLSIAVLSGEGLAIAALQAADVLAFGPLDAIDLLLKPKRLIATLRG